MRRAGLFPGFFGHRSASVLYRVGAGVRAPVPGITWKQIPAVAVGDLGAGTNRGEIFGVFIGAEQPELTGFVYQLGRHEPIVDR